MALRVSVKHIHHCHECRIVGMHKSQTHAFVPDMHDFGLEPVLGVLPIHARIETHIHRGILRQGLATRIDEGTIWADIPRPAAKQDQGIVIKGNIQIGSHPVVYATLSIHVFTLFEPSLIN